MSIIHDALKKVQHRLDKKNPTAPPAATPQPNLFGAAKPNMTSPVPSGDTFSSHRKMLIIVYAILISIGVILILVFKKLDKNPPMQVNVAPLAQEPVRVASSAPTTARVVVSQPATVAASPAPTPLPERDQTVLELGGTMLMGRERVALINDDIYEVGSIIDGKRIVEILLAEVKLVDEKTGEVSSLKVKNRR